MADKFKNRESSLESPARRADAVTPNDAADLPNSSRALYVGGAGDIQITTVGGDTVTLTGVSGFLPLCVARVHAAGTSATGIVALW